MATETEKTRRAAWTAVGVAVVVVGQTVAARAVRDGFFLSQFPASELPKMVIAASSLSVIIVLGSTHLLRRVAPAQSVPWMFGASSALFALEWLLAQYQPGVAAIVLYLHVLSVVSLVTSGFWSVVSERFDPYTAKQWIGHIGGGATLGGVLGGTAAWLAASWVDVASIILALSIVNLGCAFGVKRLGAGSRPFFGGRDEPASGLTILRQTPYLRNLALLVALAAFCQACYDIVFKTRVADYYLESSELVSFFALFYVGLSVVTFLVQNLLTRPCLSRYGLSVTVGTLPGTGIIFGAIALFSPGLSTAGLMRGSIGAVENSTYRSGYELLYTPVLPQKKRPTKTIIDVAGEMSGGVVGGACAFAVFALAPDSANTLLVVAGMLASFAGISLLQKIRAGYVNSLAVSLEAGQLDLEEAAFGTAQRALTGSTSSAPVQASDTEMSTIHGRVHRENLGAYLQQRRVEQATITEPTWQYAPLRSVAPRASMRNDANELTAAIIGLRSSDEQQIRAVLTDYTPLPSELVSVVLPLLDVPAVADSAALSLRRVAPAHLGALLDALNSQGSSRKVRLRICDLLGDVPIQRCADGLLDCLGTDDFELRLRMAASLLRISRKNSDLEIPRQRVFELAALEARYCHRIWTAQVSVDSKISSTPAIETAAGQRVIQGVTYIMTLLLTVLDPQPTIMAARALAHTSAALRGTGVEYIENVLPAGLLNELRPLLLDTRLALGKVSKRAEIIEELSGSQQTPADELAALRTRILAQRAGADVNPGPRA